MNVHREGTDFEIIFLFKCTNKIVCERMKAKRDPSCGRYLGAGVQDETRGSAGVFSAYWVTRDAAHNTFC